MDGFAGFPIRDSMPRGSGLVEFTRGERAAPTPAPKPQSPPPARQESLAVLRGAERVAAGEGHSSAAAQPSIARPLTGPLSLAAYQEAKNAGDVIKADGTIKQTK